MYVLESFCAAPRDEVGQALRSLVAFDSVVCVDAALLLRAIEVYDTDRIDFAEAYLVAGAESIDRSGTVERRPQVDHRYSVVIVLGHRHDGGVVTRAALLAAVDAAFEVTGRGLSSWPDPHPDRSPLGSEYSRLTDPGKWRIIGARADAWLVSLADAGLGRLEQGVEVRWRLAPGTVISRTDRVVPRAAGALPLVVSRSQLGTAVDAGVTLGVGDPVICVTWLPGCGCDACDSGSQDTLDELDRHILGVISGAFRRLSAGDREITVIDSDGWSASNLSRRDDVERVLCDPTGWDDVAGASWLEAV